MSRVKVSLPDQTDSEIQRLVDQGEFINRDQAIEELLSLGISAYGPTEESEDELEETGFNTVASEQQDPALQDDTGGGDDYGF